MKCKKCVKVGLRSRLKIGMSSSTAMGFEHYYDEEGDYHYHDPNATTTSYYCSKGHRGTVKVAPHCGSCDYGAKPEESWQ